MQTYNHFIDGGEVEPDDGEWLDSIDPYLGEPWARIARGTAADVDRAVTAAARAMREGPWASTTAGSWQWSPATPQADGTPG